MKKCSKNSVFFTIWVSEFGALIFGRSNGPNISGFRIIGIYGLQHWSCSKKSISIHYPTWFTRSGKTTYFPKGNTSSCRHLQETFLAPDRCKDAETADCVAETNAKKFCSGVTGQNSRLKIHKKEQFVEVTLLAFT